MKLGGCFMQLGRPVDAVEAYRTALDFSTEGGQGSIYAQLGLAYMASNRVAEAADAFTQAVSDPSYQLTAEEQTSFSAAQKALAAIHGDDPSETDQLLAHAGYGAEGPEPSSPEDTGFFSVTEEDLMNADKHERKMRRKHSHRGLKALVVIIVLLVILGGGGAFAYFKGYGWPTQESVASDMFAQAASGNDIAPYLADGVTTDVSAQIEAIMPLGATSKVTGVDRSVASSTVLVEATLSDGGTQDYTVTLVRSGLGWKVTGVELSFSSQGASTTSGTLATTSSAATQAATN